MTWLKRSDDNDDDDEGVVNEPTTAPRHDRRRQSTTSRLRSFRKKAIRKLKQKQHHMTSSPSKAASAASNGSSSLRDATASGAQSFINDLISSSLPSSSVDGAKQALSLRTTTLKFTRFVHKTGPVFDVSDAIESVVRWQDPIKTVFVGCCWALLCLYPALVLLLPSVAISTILLYNHSRRFPPSPISVDNPYQETLSSSSSTKPPPSGQPPTEGSVDYFKNLQNIQELMGRVSDATDAGRSIVPYFNWSNERLSTVLLQLSSGITILLGLGLYLASPWLDMRYVFLLVGEVSLLASHPFSLSLGQAFLSSSTTKSYTIKLQAIAEQFMKDDSLSDEIVLLPSSHGSGKAGRNVLLKDIVVYENERRSLDGSWSCEVGPKGGNDTWRPWEVFLDGVEYESATTATTPSMGLHTSEQQQHSLASSTSSNTSSSPQREIVKLETIIPPRGFAWVEAEEWQIDRLGFWTKDIGAIPDDKHSSRNSGRSQAGEVDAEGWAFMDSDGGLMSASNAGTGGQGRAKGAMRRRRWIRRIVSVPTY